MPSVWDQPIHESYVPMRQMHGQDIIGAVMVRMSKPAMERDGVSEVQSQAKRASWMAKGKCRGMNPALWFPGPGATDQARKAKEICAGCVVKKECYDFAQQEGIYDGIWGGKSERERMRDRRAGVQRVRAGSRVEAPPTLLSSGLSEEEWTQTPEAGSDASGVILGVLRNNLPIK